MARAPLPHATPPAPAIALLLLAGCVARPLAVAPQRPDPEMARVIVLAADQVRRCYRAPRAGRDGRGIVTKFRVAYAPDGQLAQLPALLGQRGVTDDNRFVAARLAEAAGLAIIQCVPLKLPAAQYRGGWDSFELTFSPKAVA